MFDKPYSIEELIEGNHARQRDIDEIFGTMSQGFPENAHLTQLYLAATECVFQGEALLGAIKDVFAKVSTPPSGNLIPRMVIEAANLPEQIALDKKLIAYLKSEYSFLHKSPA